MFNTTDDLDEILEVAEVDVATFHGGRLLITGASGFVGRWFVESVLWANRRLNAQIRVVLLARNVHGFITRFPQIASAREVELLHGDVLRPLSTGGSFDGIFHAATVPADGHDEQNNPGRAIFDGALRGTENVLAAMARNPLASMLFTSSGAIYGRQSSQTHALGETVTSGPDPLSSDSAYAEGKRAAEFLCRAAVDDGLKVKVARLFAFVGPYLPLNRTFAAGNFIRDALSGGPIVVRGDGRTMRSYLYASDMTAWLWRVFAQGKAGRAYNVGSNRATTIAELADLISLRVHSVASITERLAEHIGPVPSYLPDVSRIKNELGVEERVSLEAALERTLAYYRDSATGLPRNLS